MSIIDNNIDNQVERYDFYVYVEVVKTERMNENINNSCVN